MKRLLLLLLAAPLLLAAGPPVPTGTMTLTSTDPVTFEVDYGRKVNANRWLPYVMLSCTEDGWVTLSYLGYEPALTPPVVFDATVWVRMVGTVPVGTCQAYLIVREAEGTVEYVLDYIEPFST